MTRIAVGDLLMDIELPSYLRCSYDESGALLAVDASDRFTLHISGITVQGKDPAARNLCVKNVIEGAAKLGVSYESVSDALCFYQENKPTEWGNGPGINEFWIVGFGNRELVMTLSYLESDRSFLDLEGIRATVEKIIRSVRLTFPDKQRKGNAIDIFDLEDSQRRWFQHHRTDIAARVRKTTGFDGDGLIPLEVLDEFWGRFIAAPPNDSKTVDAVVNGIGVMLGDHLVRAKSFEWAIISDSYGVCLAVVALRGTANVNTDPFNFVAKRWERKEPKFLYAGFQAICKTAEEMAADWASKSKGGATTSSTSSLSVSNQKPWWKIW
ncbi:MAG: DUF3806 domain-containing protein [Nibricoccus sp.]